MPDYICLETFLKECAGINYEKNGGISRHTTFRIGGNADYIVYPETESAFCTLTDYLENEKIKYCVIGNGSNVLFSDEGYRGVVIITSALKKIRVSGNIISAGCGANFTKLANYAYEYGLTGLEFAYGIPGSVGGAVYMNAGAYDGEVADILLKSTYFNPSTGEKGILYKKAHDFSYRHSVYTQNNNIILSASFELKQGNKEEIKAKMDDFMSRRKEKQPLEYPSAGSTFKRYPGFYTAKLIDEAGLKGYSVGGAQVSEKHAGFVINKGGATSDDVKKLIKIIKQKLFEKNGIDIEEEIKIID